MNFSHMSIRDMLQVIIDKKAPYAHDRIKMAVQGFEQHSEYAKEILKRLEEKTGIDVKENE